jgi:methylmalonyl-CoA/ethylmalonyl-CoA epimerase
MQLTQIHQIAAHTRDLDEAIAFYRDVLGAHFIASFDPPGLAFFDFEGVRLLLEKNAPKATLYFRVDDIDTTYRELAAKGVVFEDTPHLIHRDDNGTFGAPGAEEWMVFFKDPSENLLVLVMRR